jgi:hypothetical protein
MSDEHKMYCFGRVWAMLRHGFVDMFAELLDRGAGKVSCTRRDVHELSIGEWLSDLGTREGSGILKLY